MQRTAERTSEATPNREIVRRAIAGLTSAVPPDLDGLAPGHADATRVHCSGPGHEVCGVRGVQPASRDLFAAFSDARVEIERMDEVGERVISHVRFTGRHTRSYQGTAPSGRKMQARGVLVHDVHDGRVTDAWSVLDWR